MIKLGPAGSSGLGSIAGLKNIKEKGLNAMEVEFTHGVRMKEEKAFEIKALSTKLGISLSVHCPYYINLVSKDEEKIRASESRILESCRLANLMGAFYVVFHAGFYQGRDKKIIYKKIKERIKYLKEQIKKNHWDVVLAPEVTGKNSQFGELQELLDLREDAGCELCVDFAHIKARHGKINYKDIFSRLKGLNYLHAHFSGVEYSNAGERRHVKTEKEEIKSFLKEAVKSNINMTVINESPTPLEDSILTNELLKQIN